MRPDTRRPRRRCVFLDLSLIPHPHRAQQTNRETVYLCPTPDTCAWKPPSASCISLDTSSGNPPTLIGPDYGGACQLYSTPDCAILSALHVSSDVQGAGQTDQTSGNVVCPGIRGQDVPSEVRGVFCFALGASEGTGSGDGDEVEEDWPGVPYMDGSGSRTP